MNVMLRHFQQMYLLLFSSLVIANSADVGRLRIISYATDAAPAKYLQQFTSNFDLDFELVGVGDKWTGFNSKVRGFYNYLQQKQSEYSQNDIIVMLDAYDTVVICDEDEFVEKFRSFNTDIVFSTGKECWPDPNLQQFLLDRMEPEFRAQHSWFPYFVCINSGAIMGKFPAIYNMVQRVHEIVAYGNGSCHDFQGNAFSLNIQSDQRCYTTFYVEWLNRTQFGVANSDTQPVDIKLDHTHALFATMGAMLAMNYDIDMQQESNGKMNISVVNRYTGQSACVLHGNGPGVILWRSLVKQILNNGSLEFGEYLERVVYDFYVGTLDVFTIPYQRVSHYVSKRYKLDIGWHSSNFNEGFAVRTNAIIMTVLAVFVSLCYIPCKCAKTKKVKFD